MMSSATSFTLARSFSAPRFESKLSEQLSQRAGDGESSGNADSSSEISNLLEPRKRTSPKSRSLSDASRHVYTTQHIPRVAGGSSSKDDSSISPMPATPQRPSSLQPGLSFNPTSRLSGSPSISSRGPLSPKLDPSHTYDSPGSVLPRRSRGLDFSRACTNLHHSTLAESSPESSPTIGGKGVNIPRRRGSLGSTSVNQFSYGGPGDRTGISSSVSSVNMIESDTSSSEEEDDSMSIIRDEMITNTPQLNKVSGLGPFPGNIPSPGNEWMGSYSQAASSLMSFQRARFRTGRSRHSSSSASGNSSKPSPAPASPPVMKSIENHGAGYFGMKNPGPSRRESLSFGTRDMRLSDLSDDGDARASRVNPAGTAISEGGPLGVVRRAVTRRGNLLPKTKTFARIRAALMEETAPIDSEAKREAEVIRQVRESEPAITHKSPTVSAFPCLSSSEHEGGILDADDMSMKPGASGPTNAIFNQQGNRYPGESEFWNSFDERYRTPPPLARQMSEDDSTMDITPSALGMTSSEFAKPLDRPNSLSSTPFAAPYVPMLGDSRRKRRREDDVDSNLFKRRAVSPSNSLQGSPIMPSSPVVREPASNGWGASSKSTFAGSAESTNRNPQLNMTPRRVGLQGMNETSDGFMNMSIE